MSNVNMGSRNAPEHGHKPKTTVIDKRILANAIQLLHECTPFVTAHNQAEHMLDGFGQKQQRSSDDLVERLKKFLDENTEK